MENKIVIATRMLAKSNVVDKPKILEVIYDRFGAECEIFYIQALQDSDYKVRISGVKIMVDLLEEGALKYIEPLKSDKNFWVRRTVAKLCNKISIDTSSL